MAVTVDKDRVLRTSYNMEPGMIYFLKSDLEEIEGRPKGGEEGCRYRKICLPGFRRLPARSRAEFRGIMKKPRPWKII